VSAPRSSARALLQRWASALQGCNVPEVRSADWLSRWLVISRACVLSMTASSALIGVLLAAEKAGLSGVSWLAAALCTAGLLAAHLSNNLLNDWTDTRRGVDTEDYPRAQYSPHPLLGGLTTPEGLLAAALILLGFATAVMAALILLRGWPVALFAAAGLALSLSYTGFLKRHGLGELAALLAWGPLMIGGAAYACSGRLDPAYFAASLPYGLAVASVLVGKHIDKREADRKVGVRSVPVLLGEERSRALALVLFVAFYALTAGLAALRLTGPLVLLVLASLPRLVRVWKIYRQPRPASPPEDWTVWPLWYVGWAMYLNRLAGLLLVAGLLGNVLLRSILALAR
jgi:1,4-dihydroxy-2-naphthoate octaprenyltransferase